MTVGLTLIPQGLAMAAVAGLPPQYGLYSSFVPCFVYTVFGSSHVITIGPTAILAIMTLNYTAGKPIEYAVLLCFSTGLVTFLMGVFRLGFITNFISVPVSSAFTSAAAITICLTQVRSLLGLSFKGEGFIPVLFGVYENFNRIRSYDVMVSLACMMLLMLLKELPNYFQNARFSPLLKTLSISRNVVVIITFTILFGILNQCDVVNLVGYVQPGLPNPQIPSIWGRSTHNLAINLSTNAMQILPDEGTQHGLVYLLQNDALALLVLPFLALMEHVMSAKMFAAQGKVDVSQELIAIGISNIAASFLSSMPVTGAFSRTVLNNSSGVKTPLSGIFTGILVVLSLQIATTWFFFIPKAALAAVICFAVLFTVDFSIVLQIWRTKRLDLIPWSVTFGTSLLLGLEYGILLGLLCSTVFLLYWAARPKLRIHMQKTDSGTEYAVIELDRSLTFPSMDYIQGRLLKRIPEFKGSNAFVLDCSHVMYLDFTALQGIRSLESLLSEQGKKLVLYKAKPSVVRMFSRSEADIVMCASETELESFLLAMKSRSACVLSTNGVTKKVVQHDLTGESDA